MRPLLGAALLLGSWGVSADTVYRVKRNETLTSVSRQQAVPLSALAARNQMRATDQLSVGQLIFIPGSPPEPVMTPVEYVVKAGDSMAIIAQKFKVTVAALAKRNRIERPGEIKVGQRLEIPAIGPREVTGLESALKKQLNHIRVDSNRWKRIVIHHSGTPLDTVAGMDRYHREERHMENGLAYHFVIGNGIRTREGEIFVGPRWKNQLDGGHLRSEFQNRSSIGICLIGDFDQRPPSEKQLEAASALVGYLLDRCNIGKKNVFAHRDINMRPTECPGSKFPFKKFLARFPSK